jgi:tRNA (mo5U34)-methyltransferase
MGDSGKMTASDLDIGSLADRAKLFRNELDRTKAEIALPGPGWYPYDSLAAFLRLHHLLRERQRQLLALVGELPVLDAGCGDGAISFFLESLGCTVHALDNKETNFNQMEGVKALKAALRSTVEIHEVDLDTQFTLPDVTFGLTIFLGTLYHLKNPFFVLETLAQRTRYCVMSTRLARFDDQRDPELQRLAVAYLVDEHELNLDKTNFWLFTEEGLRRTLKRCGWHVHAWSIAEDPVRYDTGTITADVRVHCLLQSRLTNSTPSLDLGEGWYRLEKDNWRWTGRRFSLLVEPACEAGSPCNLKMRFTIAQALIDQLQALSVSATVNGAPLAASRYSEPGEHVYLHAVPAGTLVAHQPALVEFELDKALSPTETDTRALGLQVLFEYEDGSSPIEIF